MKKNIKIKYLSSFLKNKMIIFLLISFTSSLWVVGEDDQYKDDEYLKFRIHYGFVNAGYATLNLNEVMYAGRPHFHATGKGWTVGAVKLFFKVEDDYQTYIDKNTKKPSRFFKKSR